MKYLPILPHTKKFEVPEEFKDFLIYDSGTEDPERFLIFGQQTPLELLESTQHLWLADGNFKLCLEIFLQLFTIHTSINGYNRPCIYALLPNKCEKTYERLLIGVKEKIPNSSPTKILMDFKKAVMNAFEKNFTDATLSGCYFHLCQSFV